MRILINEGVLFQELQGEAVLLNVNSGVYFGLDTVATRIWQLLAEHKTLPEIANAVTAAYDVTAERCQADVLALVEQLEAQGLITIVPQ